MEVNMVRVERKERIEIDKDRLAQLLTAENKIIALTEFGSIGSEEIKEVYKAYANRAASGIYSLEYEEVMSELGNYGAYFPDIPED